VSEPAFGWQAARTAQMSPKSVGLNPNTTVSNNRAVEPEAHALPSLLFWLCRPRTIINFS
jgi:hypothetical protein